MSAALVPLKSARQRPSLAILDEDRQFAAALAAALDQGGYRCTVLLDAVESLRALERANIQALILDLADAHLNRLEVIRRVRSSNELPILVITRGSDEAQKISALDAGADDYMTKPLALGEFLARLRVALRHGRARRSSQSGQVEVGALRIELLQRQVSLHGERIALTPTDYKLLALLARNQGRVVPHQQLLREGWGPNAHDPHYLRVYMARLRRKLDPERLGFRYIVTEPGVGYRLVMQIESRRESDSATNAMS